MDLALGFQFNRNILAEIKNFPQSSIGAPIPVVLSDEHKFFLCYYVEDIAEGWNGTPVQVGADTEDEAVAIINFEKYRIYKFGPPNDEAIAGHPLFKKGLKPYSIFKLEGSSWITELEKINSVHPSHDKKKI